jgi:hypothetical protein
MGRRLLTILLALSLCAACVDDRITLQRGPLGPAAYRIVISVDGVRAVGRDTVRATLRVARRRAGATLTLTVDGRKPVVATLASTDGRLELEEVRGGSPGSVGEADLASLVGQLDPPLPPKAVRLREPWSETRRIATAALTATLRSDLRIERFRRIAGVDAAELVGNVQGDLRTASDRGSFEGRVQGRTTIDWELGSGRVVASRTHLVWTTTNAGRVVLDADVRPA